MARMRYRLALDLGSTSLGWALVQLDGRGSPCALIRTGARIFSDGRNPKDGSSLAVTRREARAMRRRRDRLLKRKARMERLLIKHGFFPADQAARKALELLNPYELRAKGLDVALTPAEFARALFHINQRRGFKSNRKTDKKNQDSGVLDTAIRNLRAQLDPLGADGKARTVGELLHRRFTDESKPPEQRTVRARNNGMKGPRLTYDLYIDRAMIEAEFEALWAKQAAFQPSQFCEPAYKALKDCLLHQRALRPVKPGRCTLIPHLPRAPLALPSQQRFRMYQEVNNLKILRIGIPDAPLTHEQRDRVIEMLERPAKEMKKAHEVSFDSIRSALHLGGTAQFNLQDVKRDSLKGNSTTASLSKRDHFGTDWHSWTERQQDAIVRQLINQQRRDILIRRLMKYCLVDEARAGRIADAGLPDGFGALSSKALSLVLPELRRNVVSFAEAAKLAGFHHSNLAENTEIPGRTFLLENTSQETGEIKTFHVFKKLPYYGEFLTRHVGFADPEARLDPNADMDALPGHILEKFHGRIANPTVHIGLNQVRVVVNNLIRRYGHPSEVVIEVANELKRRPDHRSAEFRIGPITESNYRPFCSCAGCIHVQQKLDQDLNRQLRQEAAETRECSLDEVTYIDLLKLRLRKEMAERDGIVQCPYSGMPLSGRMVLSDEVEIDHILPYSRTLDDSRANKTLCIKLANRIKGERTPYEAKELFAHQGWMYEDIERRIGRWDKKKAFRFGSNAINEWRREHQDFLARALNDTRYLCRVAREYLTLICPQATWVIPGQMTSMIAHRYGLYRLIHPEGKNEKNRNDHRHHAIDACVIAITDRGLLKRFADASAAARDKGLKRLTDALDLPWHAYYEHVQRAINATWVSHKPDHGHEGAMFDATIYSASGKSASAAKDRTVIPFAARADHAGAIKRHIGKSVEHKPYKGLLSNSNFCIEVFRLPTGTWGGKVLRTFDAYQVVKKFSSVKEGVRHLRNPGKSLCGNSLVMRLMIADYIRAEIDGELLLLQVLKINSSGSVTFIKPNETNISARYASKLAAQKHQRDGLPFDANALTDNFFQKALSAESLMLAKARQVTISPIGELRDPGFKE